MISNLDLGDFPLFAGIESRALERILAKLRPLTFAAGGYICRQGEQGESLFLIHSGLVEVWLETSEGSHLVRRLRQGEVVGEMALLTGEPRSATVIAALPSTVLELDSSTFAAIVADYPAILHNIALVFIEREHASAQVRLRRNRGEAVALVVGQSCRPAIPVVVEAVENASFSDPTVVDLTASVPPRHNRPVMGNVGAVLGQLDTLLHDTQRVLVVVEDAQPELAALLRHMDRLVLMMDPEETDRHVGNFTSGLPAEVFLAGGGLEGEARSWAVPIVHNAASSPSPRDIRWLGRHLARTKLGLALGAGGAKGFAHVGAYRALEEAGFVFDYIAGSSIGSILGSCIAMGMSADELSSAAFWLLSREVCGTYFRLTEGEPDEPGHKRFYEALSELAGGRRFSDLPVPLAVMTADLNSRMPFVFQLGALEEALHAALSIPGLAPPFERENQRLVDGVTISPVPTHVLRDMGADITVSVNLMSRDELDRWPEDEPVPVIEKKRSKTLDPMIETLIMLQLDTSMRNAAKADVMISPRFAPSSWRDIHLADRFEAAGLRAAREQISALHALVGSR